MVHNNIKYRKLECTTENCVAFIWDRLWEVCQALRGGYYFPELVSEECNTIFSGAFKFSVLNIVVRYNKKLKHFLNVFVVSSRTGPTHSIFCCFFVFPLTIVIWQGFNSFCRAVRESQCSWQDTSWVRCIRPFDIFNLPLTLTRMRNSSSVRVSLDPEGPSCIP